MVIEAQQARKPAPATAIVVNEPSQAALARAYAYLDEMAPVIEARRREREARRESEEGEAQ